MSGSVVVEAPPSHPWLAAYPPGIAWDGLPPPSTLTAIWDAAAARFASRPCVTFFGRTWTYADMAALVDRAAEGFRRLGIGPGMRVGLCLPNTPFYITAFHGALKAGAAVVNFNPLYTASELAHQAKDADIAVMVTVDLEPILGRVLGLLADGPVRHVVACRFASALPAAKGLAFRVLKRRAIGRVPSNDPRVLDFAALTAGPPIAAPAAVQPSDLAVLQYTGGTTGIPKGAMLTHGNLAANLNQVRAWFPQCRLGEERVLAVLPFFHVFALTSVMNASLAWGAELVLLPRFELGPFMKALRACRPTMLAGVPTLFKAVLDAGATRADLGSVRAAISGGAPLPAEVKRAFDALGGAGLVEGYGLTEASPVCFCNPTEGENRLGTIGLPLPGIEAELRDPANPMQAVPLGARGELCVRGPNVMAGYWRQPEETARVLLPDGFLRTGDIGVMAADGYVTLVDRIKDIIICSGFNVYPRVIEDAIYACPGVAAVTVVGMADDYRGESPAAFVQAEPGAALTAESVKAFLKDRLSPIEMPRLIEIRDTLPRTAVGKLSKTELRQELHDRA